MRSQNSNAWETTKYHLKLAKTNTSLRNIEQLTLVRDQEEDEGHAEVEAKNGMLTISERSETETHFMAVR